MPRSKRRGVLDGLLVKNISLTSRYHLSSDIVIVFLFWQVFSWELEGKSYPVLIKSTQGKGAPLFATFGELLIQWPCKLHPSLFLIDIISITNKCRWMA